jgi:hypothetical protein
MPDDKKTADLTAKANAFLKLVIAGDVANATPKLNDAMRQAMPADSLKQLWTGLEAQAGKYQPGGASGVKVTNEDGYDCVYLESKFEKSVLWVKVVFQGESVAGLQFVPHAP